MLKHFCSSLSQFAMGSNSTGYTRNLHYTLLKLSSDPAFLTLVISVKIIRPNLLTFDLTKIQCHHLFKRCSLRKKVRVLKGFKMQMYF